MARVDDIYNLKVFYNNYRVLNDFRQYFVADIYSLKFKQVAPY